MSKAEEVAKLEELLRKQQNRRSDAKAAKRALREAKRALHALKGKIAAQRERVQAYSTPRHKRAVNWAMAQQGVAEKPDGSNWGVPVQDWIKYTGYSGPVPWCGCFVAWAACKVGRANVPNRIRLGYNEYIVQDALSRRNGLKQVSWDNARPGDIVVFTFPHIALVRAKPSASALPTIEGNTSPLDSGSQANGGTVAAKTRPRSQVRLIARPIYPDA